MYTRTHMHHHPLGVCLCICVCMRVCVKRFLLLLRGHARGGGDTLSSLPPNLRLTPHAAVPSHMPITHGTYILTRSLSLTSTRTLTVTLSPTLRRLAKMYLSVCAFACTPLSEYVHVLARMCVCVCVCVCLCLCVSLCVIVSIRQHLSV